MGGVEMKMRRIVNQGTIRKVKEIFACMETEGVFGRSDIAAITGDSVTAAGKLVVKLKNAGLIENVSGYGKGKYRFTGSSIKNQ